MAFGALSPAHQIANPSGIGASQRTWRSRSAHLSASPSLNRRRVAGAGGSSPAVRAVQTGGGGGYGGLSFAHARMALPNCLPNSPMGFARRPVSYTARGRKRLIAKAGLTPFGRIRQRASKMASLCGWPNETALTSSWAANLGWEKPEKAKLGRNPLPTH